jgi:ribosomal protein S20
MDLINKLLVHNIGGPVNSNAALEIAFQSFFVNIGLRNVFFPQTGSNEVECKIINKYMTNTYTHWQEDANYFFIVNKKFKIDSKQLTFKNPDYNIYLGKILGYFCPGMNRPRDDTRNAIAIEIVYKEQNINVLTFICKTLDAKLKTQIKTFIKKLDNVIHKYELPVKVASKITVLHSFSYFINKIKNKKVLGSDDNSRIWSILHYYGATSSAKLLNKNKNIYFNKKFTDHIINILILVKQYELNEKYMDIVANGKYDNEILKLYKLI